MCESQKSTATTWLILRSLISTAHWGPFTALVAGKPVDIENVTEYDASCPNRF
jgi:hypothetical protein